MQNCFYIYIIYKWEIGWLSTIEKNIKDSVNILQKTNTCSSVSILKNSNAAESIQMRLNRSGKKNAKRKLVHWACNEQSFEKCFASLKRENKKLRIQACWIGSTL